ncbi:MAG: DUF4007 family protein [Rhodospirillaceae bacterium]|nr:DUF4007 family protein [Rhodospirillaceae bacterium]
MARGPIFQEGYKHQLSGHETFPLRYGWLKKAFDAVEATEGEAENKWVFLRDDAIARFGVGKNMVASMRHWAVAADIIAESPGSNLIKTTALGQKLFGRRGFDPYMEYPATLWLVHWKLAARADKTAWFWAFNHYPALTFDREHLVKGIARLAKDRAWARVAETTVKNDVACFVRTYVAQQPSGQAGNDDALESPLIELGLIKAVGKRDGFRFVRGPKSTLGDGVFVYALLDFWSRHSQSATLSFEAIAHEPGSPGRVFLLDEDDVADRLAMLDDVTGGALRWSETAGLKQVVRDSGLDFSSALSFVDMDYTGAARQEAA